MSGRRKFISLVSVGDFHASSGKNPIRLLFAKEYFGGAEPSLS